MTTQLQQRIDQARQARQLLDQAANLEALEATAAAEAAAQQVAKQRAVDEAKQQFATSRANFDSLVERRDQLYGNAIQAIAAALEAERIAQQLGRDVLIKADLYAQALAALEGRLTAKPGPRWEAESMDDRRLVISPRKQQLLTAAGVDPSQPVYPYPFGTSDAARAAARALNP